MGGFKIVRTYARNGKARKVAVDENNGKFAEVQFDKRLIIEFAVDRLYDNAFRAECDKIVYGFGFFFERVDRIFIDDVVSVSGGSALYGGEDLQPEAESNITENQAHDMLLRLCGDIFHKSAAPRRAGDVSLLFEQLHRLLYGDAGYEKRFRKFEFGGQNGACGILSHNDVIFQFVVHVHIQRMTRVFEILHNLSAKVIFYNILS